MLRKIKIWWYNHILWPRWYERLVIKKLSKTGLFPDRDINQVKKEIDLGTLGFSWCFANNFEKMLIYTLVEKYGWQAYQNWIFGCRQQVKFFNKNKPMAVNEHGQLVNQEKIKPGNLSYFKK